MIRGTHLHIPATLALIAMAGLAGMAGVQNSWAQAAAPVAATKSVSVNGKVIPKSRVDFVIKQRAAQGQPDNEQARKSIMDTLVNQEILAQEAEKKGLGKNGDVQTQVDIARQTIMAQAAIADYVKAHPIADDVVRAEYDKVKAQRGTQEYRARHILVDTEAEAKGLIDKLKKGEKFEDLAKVSKDPGSKDKGGELDWAAPTNYVKPFADALVKLDKGKYTDTPVQSQFGWHVIRLDDVRSTQFPPFDQVKQQITNMLQDQNLQKMVADLRSKAKIE